jgi:hypothetical protein
MGLIDQIEQGNWLVVGFGGGFLVLQVLVFAEAIRRWLGTSMA